MSERERLCARLPGVKRRQEAMPREVATWFRRFLFSGYLHALGFDLTH